MHQDLVGVVVGTMAAVPTTTTAGVVAAEGLVEAVVAVGVVVIGIATAIAIAVAMAVAIAVAVAVLVVVAVFLDNAQNCAVLSTCAESSLPAHTVNTSSCLVDRTHDTR